jgi:hypothetical protein
MDSLAAQISKFLDEFGRTKNDLSDFGADYGDYIRVVMVKFNLNWPSAVHYFDLWSAS